MPEQSTSSSLPWLLFAGLTVVSWGTYGLLLHTGQLQMADPLNGRYKAFLFVGLAYVLVAVLAPIAMLLVNGTDWRFPAGGAWWSLVAGIAGAVGAFGVLLAFANKGSPAAVMAIVFAGAPIVNALVSLWLHPPAGGWSSIRPEFFIGIVLAAAGGSMVTYFKPPPSKPASPPAAVSSTSPAIVASSTATASEQPEQAPPQEPLSR